MIIDGRHEKPAAGRGQRWQPVRVLPGDLAGRAGGPGSSSRPRCGGAGATWRKCSNLCRRALGHRHIAIIMAIDNVGGAADAADEADVGGVALVAWRGAEIAENDRRRVTLGYTPCCLRGFLSGWVERLRTKG